jgi:hypothetical protein
MSEIPYNIVNYRREQCERCPTPCEFQYDLRFRSNGDSSCPLNKWMKYQTYARPGKRFNGAGDVIALFAQPVAGAIDYVLNTKVRKCAACAKRKEMLNQMLPFGS